MRVVVVVRIEVVLHSPRVIRRIECCTERDNILLLRLVVVAVEFVGILWCRAFGNAELRVGPC